MAWRIIIKITNPEQHTHRPEQIHTSVPFGKAHDDDSLYTVWAVVAVQHEDTYFSLSKAKGISLMPCHKAWIKSRAAQSSTGGHS